MSVYSATPSDFSSGELFWMDWHKYHKVHCMLDWRANWSSETIWTWVKNEGCKRAGFFGSLRKCITDYMVNNWHAEATKGAPVITISTSNNKKIYWTLVPLYYTNACGSNVVWVWWGSTVQRHPFAPICSFEQLFYRKKVVEFSWQ